MDKGLFRILGITLIAKLSALLLIALGYRFLPFQFANYLANFHDPNLKAPTLLTAYQTWDAQHYLYLAVHGYQPYAPSNAFYPLFPLLMRLCSFLTGLALWIAGFFVSNLLALFASAFLYLLVKNLYNEKIAFRACLWCLAFPTAFYSGLLYTESLFLCLSTAFFYFSYKGLRLPAASCAFLLSLSRPTGILMASATLFGWGSWKISRKETFYHRIMSVLASFAGYGFYLVLMKLWTGNYFSGFLAQRYYTYGFSNFPNPLNWFSSNFIQIHYTFAGAATSFFPRVFFVGIVLSLPFLFKQVSLNLFIFSLVLGLVSAFSGDTMSMSYMRYTTVLFPLFILAALKIKEGFYEKILLGGCCLAQVFFLIAHSLNYWVG